jgi:intergrase/recombinase
MNIRMIRASLALLVLNWISISFAHAETTKSDALNAIDELYEKVSKTDKDQTDYETILEKVLEISTSIDVGGATKLFVCVKNGPASNDWYLFDSKKGSTVGTGTYQDNCNKSVP